VPYEQWVAFVRPDALLFGDINEWVFSPSKNEAELSPVDDESLAEILLEGFDIWVGGTYSIELLKGNLEYTQNSKYLRRSLTSPFLKGDSLFFRKDEFAYDNRAAVSYEDRWAQVDLQRILAWVFGGWESPSIEPTLLRSLYGKQRPWWGQSMLAKPTTFKVPII
jgi:hypothetical protein